MCLLNVRSLKKTDSTNSKACDLLAEDCKKYKIDICVIVETFLKPRIPDTYIVMDGYSIFRRDRRICSCRKPQCNQPHGGGGILVYVRSSIPCEVHSVSDKSESMWLKIRTINQNYEYIFLNASYAPPSSNKSYLDSLNRFIISEAQNIQHSFPKALLFIMGDFNRMCMDDVELSCCTTILPSPPTRQSAHLDLVLTNRPNLIEKIDCFSSQVDTDHKAVLVLPRRKILPDRSCRCFRLFTAQGHSNLSQSLLKKDFSDIYNKDVHDAAEALERILQNAVEDSFPLRKVKMSSRDPSWLTPKMKWLLQKKKQARRRGQTRKADRIDYRLGRAKVENLCQSETKQWWKKIDSITNRKYNAKSIDFHAFEPEELNSQLAKRSGFMEDEVREPAPDFTTSGNEQLQITYQEVSSVLKSCKRTSPGPSCIPYFVFQEYWMILAPLYWFVWNLSLTEGVFPECYKRAELIPLSKVKNASSVDQIRGISVTSIAARLFERIVHRKWISQNVLLRSDPLQFAYKSGLSTTDYLLYFQFFVLSQLDKKDTDGVHVVAVDFSKAFDSVDQELAAEEYKKFVDSPLLQKWLYDFTIERSQRLNWRDLRCTYRTIDRGCSQGTVGGPSIFSMLTDDAASSRENCRIVKYSDDMTCIIPCMKSPCESEKKNLYDEFEDFRRWATRKKLILNNDKTQQIRFSLNPTNEDLCQCKPIDDLSAVTKIKLLGIVFQRNFLFTEHVKCLISHCKSLLYLLKDLRIHKASMQDLEKLFNAVILSRIRYGISVYGCDQRALQKVNCFLQKCHIRNYISKPISAYDLLKTEDTRILNNILSSANHPLRAYILTHKKSGRTRHNFFGIRPRTFTKLFLNSFCNRILSY